MKVTAEQLKRAENSVRSVTRAASLEVHPYSGRGMYGKNCIGVTVFDMSTLYTFIYWLATETNEEEDHFARFKDLTDGMCTDSMGLGIVGYWPKISVPENFLELFPDRPILDLTTKPRGCRL